MVTPKLNITARSILFLMPAGSKPPYQVRLGLRTNNPEVVAMGDFTISDCQDVSDAVQKTLAIVEDLNLKLAADFTLVLPMFVGRTSSEEAELINTAWLIKEVADEGGWDFSRVLPTPIF